MERVYKINFLGTKHPKVIILLIGIAEKRDDWELCSQSSRPVFIPRISNAYHVIKECQPAILVSCASG